MASLPNVTSVSTKPSNDGKKAITDTGLQREIDDQIATYHRQVEKIEVKRQQAMQKQQRNIKKLF